MSFFIYFRMKLVLIVVVVALVAHELVDGSRYGGRDHHDDHGSIFDNDHRRMEENYRYNI